MNTVIRIALGVTVITCAFCIYFINNYRGRLKAAELTVASFEENATKTAVQSSSLEADNDKLEKDLKGLQAQIPLLMAQIEGAASTSGTAQSGGKETQQQLIDAAKGLRLMTSERDKYREVAKETEQLKRQLLIYQNLGTVAQLQGMKDQVNNSQTPEGAVQDPQSTGGEGRAKVKLGTELGVVLSVDSKLGFCVINCGSTKGIAKGDEFHVHRTGNFVGKIKVDEVRPTVAIATAVKNSPPKLFE